MVRLGVRDTGPGIPADRQHLLFMPFERLDAPQTGVEGTGIGLSLSRHLAEAMGGVLEVESEVGKGSLFYVDLPLVEGPVERYERLTVPAGRYQPVLDLTEERHDTVLHIEDNLSNVTLVERVLAQRPGVEVVGAMHGRLGVELARQHHPALILLDLHLPDMDGDQVLQRLRNDPDTAAIPVVILSADATPGQVKRLLATGAAGYLTKPIDVRELLGTLDDVLDARGAPTPEPGVIR
jgi:CheY-like chemotaxis protein